MRQLDLFGSFFETPPQEDKPEEKAAVSKKEERLGASVAVAPAYSKNTLRSERLVASQIAINEKITDVVGRGQPNGSTAPSPLLLSLFDAHPNFVGTGANEKETNVITKPQPENQFLSDREVEKNEAQESSNEVADKPQVLIVEVQPEQKSEVEQAEVAAVDTTHILIVEEQQTNEVEPIQVVPENLAEVLIDEKQLEIPVAPGMSKSVIPINKKAAAPKPKKQLLPELKTNGSVIFDDGKITVKIKSTSPFPAPIVRQKKERVKKPLQKRGRKSFKEIDAEVDLIEIPEDEILFQKQYYPISEVAKWFRVNTSLLRFWENEFDVLKPRKNRKGDRLFRPEDVKNLQLIYQLLRQRKYTIEGAKEYIKTNKKKADIQLHLTNTLQKFKSFLLDLKANLQA